MSGPRPAGAAGAGRWCRWEGETLLLEVRVQPRASRDRIGPVEGGRLKIRVTAPPVDEAANARVVELLAKALKVPRSAVEIRAGARGRDKRLAVRAPRAVPPWLEAGPAA